MAERNTAKPETERKKAARDESADRRSLTEPGQGEDLTQAGEVLYREIKLGKTHPEDSTPKKIK
jgi:hypothetical protein